MSLVALRYDEADDVLEGLFASHKRLPGRLLHTGAAGELFERLAAQGAHAPARIEAALLDDYLAQIAHHVGPGARVVEPGHGDVRRTRTLVQALAPSSYVPIDAVPDRLARRAAALRGDVPGTAIAPVVGDFTELGELPAPQHAARRTLVFFPASSSAAIGSLPPGDARDVLARLAQLAGPDRMLLLGSDGTRDPHALLRTYDDDRGALAAIHRAVLGELGRTRGAHFELDAFDHRAVWNAEASRVELQLVSRRRQTIAIAGTQIALAAGEPIVTDHAYKHTPAAMHAILTRASWRPRQVFTSTIAPFRLWLCEPLGGVRV